MYHDLPCEPWYKRERPEEPEVKLGGTDWISDLWDGASNKLCGCSNVKYGGNVRILISTPGCDKHIDNFIIRLR